MWHLLATLVVVRALEEACVEESFADPAVRDALSSSTNVFFLHTSSENTLTDIQRCALASAARLNPTRRVSFFSNTHSCAYLRAAVGAAVHLVRHDPRDVYEGFPSMVEWYDTRVWDMHFSGVHLSDSMRLALLFKFGGVYLDSDVVSLRPLDGLVNAVGLEDPWMINNAVLALERGHAFAAQAAHEFVNGFSATWWGWNGPRLVTRVSRAYLGERREDDVLVAPVEEFYPVSWRDWEDFFAPAPPGGSWLDRFAHTRLVHMWHSLVSKRLAETRAAGKSINGLVLGRLLDAACPAGTPGAPINAEQIFHDDPSRSQLLAGGSVEGLTAAPLPRASNDDERSNGLSRWGPGSSVARFDGTDGPPPLPCTVLTAAEGWGGTADNAAFVPRSVMRGGQYFGQVRSGAGSELRMHANAHNAGFGGSCVQAACGFSCGGSCAVGAGGFFVYLPRPERRSSAWTLTLWLSTLALDSTPRVQAHETPPVSPGALPTDDLGIPDDVPVAPSDLPPDLALDALASADAFVLGIEDGHVTAGGLNGEWIRSLSPVADGRWHHVAVTCEPLASGAVRLSLALDGVLQAQRERPVSGAFTVAILGSAAARPASKPTLFIDALGTFAAALPHSAVVRLRNAQLSVMAEQNCLPALGWRSGEVTTRRGGGPGGRADEDNDADSSTPTAPSTRIFVLVFSSFDPDAAALRLLVRQTWVQLAAAVSGARAHHVFCLGGNGSSLPAPLKLEAARYGDLVFSGTREGSDMVAGCFRAALAHADAEAAPFDFLIKTDADVFLRIDTLRNELGALLASASMQRAEEPLYYWRGFAYRNVPPGRDLGDKSADVSTTLMAFPPYMSGVGYVLSAPLVRLLAALPAPSATRLADPSLGLMIAESGVRVELEHDARFEPGASCDDGQLALRFSGNGRQAQRQLVLNARAGHPLCLGIEAPRCCACCAPCIGDSGNSSSGSLRLVCDARGAWVSGFTSLSQLAGADERGMLREAPSARELALLAVSQAAAPGSAAPTCVWESQRWSAVGNGTLLLGPDAGSPGEGVQVICQAASPMVAPFCGASVDVLPPVNPGGCSSTAIQMRPASSPPAGEGGLDSSAFPKTFRDLFLFALPCFDGTPLAAFPRPVEWLLLTAAVSTVGTTCGLAKLPLTPPATDDDMWTRYPRGGPFRAFCGLVVSVVHADGRVETFRSPFAHAASRYVHYEVLSLAHPAPVHRVRVTLVAPSADGAASSPLELRDLTVVPVDVPREREAQPWPEALRRAEAATRLSAARRHSLSSRLLRSWRSGSDPESDLALPLCPGGVALSWAPLPLLAAAVSLVLAVRACRSGAGLGLRGARGRQPTGVPSRRREAIAGRLWRSAWAAWLLLRRTLSPQRRRSED